MRKALKWDLVPPHKHHKSNSERQALRASTRGRLRLRKGTKPKDRAVGKRNRPSNRTEGSRIDETYPPAREGAQNAFRRSTALFLSRDSFSFPYCPIAASLGRGITATASLSPRPPLLGLKGGKTFLKDRVITRTVYTCGVPLTYAALVPPTPQRYPCPLPERYTLPSGPDQKLKRTIQKNEWYSATLCIVPFIFW